MKVLYMNFRILYFVPFIMLFSMTFHGQTVQADTPVKRTIPQVVDYSMPTTLTLCGEEIALTRRDVWERLDREFTISVWDRAQVFMWMKRKARYFPYIEEKLKQAGMPDDLKYLAVAESALIHYVKSRAGAVGVWQFMPATGRRYGLTKNRLVDERRSFELSTEAAINYLKFLHNKFGSWTLVMAAYNCGENRVAKEIKKQGVSNYVDLKLPRETERYVFRIASAKLILESPESFGYVLPENRAYLPGKFDMVTLKINENYHITDFAKALGLNYRDFKELNPQFLGTYMPRGSFAVKVPEDSINTVAGLKKKLGKAKKLVKSSIKSSKKIYLVKRGDTLAGISRKTGVTVSRLKNNNKIKGSKILVGQKLKL